LIASTIIHFKYMLNNRRVKPILIILCMVKQVLFASILLKEWMTYFSLEYWNNLFLF
jgi:hypothetical protein